MAIPMGGWFWVNCVDTILDRIIYITASCSLNFFSAAIGSAESGVHSWRGASLPAEARPIRLGTNS